MGKLKVFNNMGVAFSRAALKFKKHSPEIMVVAGVIGVVSSAVMACKATTKVNDILENNKAEVEKVHTVLADETISEERYSVEDSKKDLAVIYVRTGLDLIKLYAPSVILGSLSIASILTSHKILRTRNIALAAAYKAVDTGFKEYRGRVVERFGKDLDNELRFNIKAKEVETTVINEKGEEEVVKAVVPVAECDMYSDYARCFDNGCLGWEKDAEHNLYILRCYQNYANDLLKSKGHVFLNEVYDMLGIPRTKAGNIVGWVYDEKDPVGDNYIDFGIYNIHNEQSRDFVNGYERSIWLDFNVDGNILDLI